MHKNIIDISQDTVPGIDQSLDLVGKEAQTFSDWRLKGLGLKQVLLQLAAVHAQRLSKLAVLVYKLEDRLVDSTLINSLDPRQLFSLYKLTTEATQEASSYIQTVVKEMNWSDLESDLLLSVTQTDDKNISSKEFATMARDVLSALAKEAATTVAEDRKSQKSTFALMKENDNEEE